MIWAVKEKAKPGGRLTARQRARNHRFGKVRAKVEHVFRVFEVPVRLWQGAFSAWPRTGPRCSRCWRSQRCISLAGHLRPPDDPGHPLPPAAVSYRLLTRKTFASAQTIASSVDQSFLSEPLCRSPRMLAAKSFGVLIIFGTELTSVFGFGSGGHPISVKLVPLQAAYFEPRASRAGTRHASTRRADAVSSIRASKSELLSS